MSVLREREVAGGNGRDPPGQEGLKCSGFMRMRSAILTIAYWLWKVFGYVISV